MGKRIKKGTEKKGPYFPDKPLEFSWGKNLAVFASTPPTIKYYNPTTDQSDNEEASC